MLITKNINVKWHGNNKKHYISKGYIFTNYADSFLVDVKDLPSKTNVGIVFSCDYCNKEVSRIYSDYNIKKEASIVKKDCCSECQSLKTKEVFNLKYGVDNVFQLPEIKKKSRETTLNKYGEEYYMQTEEGKNRIHETSLKLYGSDWHIRSEVVQQKVKDTMMMRYGVIYSFANEIIAQKSMDTFLKNGNIKTSSQQVKIYETLKELGYNVELNYPISRVSLDVALFINDIKIDIEYDGWVWHNSTRDRRRDEFLKSQGWKIMRIKSGHKLPTIDQLKIAIEDLTTTDYKYYEIVLDDWKEDLVAIGSNNSPINTK